MNKRKTPVWLPSYSNVYSMEGDSFPVSMDQKQAAPFLMGKGTKLMGQKKRREGRCAEN